MKKYFFIILSAIGLLTTSCSKDGDMVTVGTGDAVLLDGSNTIVLDKNNATGLAMTLSWNDNHVLTTNYSDVLIPNNSIINTVQISSTADFAKMVEEEMGSGIYMKQFTNAALNSELSKLGYNPFVEQDMYVRIASSRGNNLTPEYSNTLAFRVTPYKIDFTKAFVLKADKSDTGMTLSSPTENGIYTGFIGQSAWGNWWLMEGDGTVWGNDDVTGTPFMMSSAGSAWNFWCSDNDGCRFVTVDTKKKEWTDLAIPTLKAEGDITGDMTYSKANNQWTLSFDATTTAPVKVKFYATDAKQYTVATGADKDKGIATPVYLTADGVTTDASQALEVTLTAPAVGKCTMTIDFTNPSQTAFSIEEGGAEPEPEISQVLCVMGNDDKWDHTEWIRLSDEDNKTYTGAVNMNSSWGYYFTKTIDSDDWTQVNQDPDVSEMKLKEGGNAITAPGKGLYIVSASLGYMSYWYEMNGDAVTSVSYTGLNDDWSTTEMTATAEPGVYTATITVTKDTPWGMQILINGSWDYWFGTKSDGTLCWKKKNDGNPVGAETPGTYTLTVDICRGTYSIKK